MPAHINNWGDLQKYGINCLTGEACAYSMRLLCDLNEEGAKSICDFFGIPLCTTVKYAQFAANRNSMVGDKPAVASIMLTRGIFDELARFLLFNVDNVDYVVGSGSSGFAGYTKADLVEYGKDEKDLSLIYKHCIWRNNKNAAASVGDRNVHQMTERTT